MTALGTYLWKEWRDQRALLVGYALLVPILMAIAMLAIPGPWARNDALPTFVALGGLLIGALTLASDLVPGELRRGHLGFLARLPGDLRTAFIAKLLFCVVGLTAFCLHAWLSTTVLSAALAGGKWYAPFGWDFLSRFDSEHAHWWMKWSLLDPLVVLCLWIFAVSCWLPRGTLALPAALLVLALICGPMAALLLEHRGLAIHREEIDALRIWLPASALVTAALAFLRGGRLGRRPLRLAGWTTVGTLLAATPVWAWSANRWHDYVALDLKSDSLALEPVALGEDGRFVFANVQPRIARYGGGVEDEAIRPVVVDLETGELRVAGAIETQFEVPDRRRSLAMTPLVFVAAASRTGPIEWSDAFDGQSGQRLDGAKWKALLGRGLAIDDAILRARDSIVLPDGSRCWMNGRTLHVEARDGTTKVQEFGPSQADGGWQVCGAGFQRGWCGDFVDVVAGRLVAGATVNEALSRCMDGSSPSGFGMVHAVRAGGWLLRVAHDRRAGELDYVLWLPGEKRFKPALGMGPRDYVVAAMTDGRILVASVLPTPPKSYAPVEIALVDPDTGARSLVSLPAGTAIPVAAWLLDRLPSGALVIALHSMNHPPEPTSRIARVGLDGVVQVAAVLPGDTSAIGCPDESTILLLNENRRILRARFDGSPYEVLFPKPER